MKEDASSMGTSSKARPPGSPWFYISRPNPAASLRLFCFPYAGGSTAIYRAWPAALPNFEVCAVHLPGRGNRLREPAFASVRPLIEALAPAFEPFADKPFAFYGHSMGAIVGFELAHGLRERMGIEPAHLIISGRQPPSVPDTHPPTHNLPEPQFIAELRRLNGTPKDVLDNQQLMQLMLPLLRADFQLCETYKCLPRPPLSCSVTAMRGVDDPDIQNIEGWCDVTTGRCSVRVFPGDHFFLHTFEKQLLELISRELQEVKSKARRD